MTLYATALWLYAVMASLVLGASLYESLVVHPAWSRKPPDSFVGFVGAPISRMNIPAFWVPVAPLYALSSLGALAVALWAGRLTMPLTVSAACAVSGVVWTLVYFRPTIGRFLETGGREHSRPAPAVRGTAVDSAQLDPSCDGRGLLVGCFQGNGSTWVNAHRAAQHVGQTKRLVNWRTRSNPTRT